MSEQAGVSNPRLPVELNRRNLILALAAAVALGSAASFWLAGLAALTLRTASRYELVAAGDRCFLLDRQSGAVQQTGTASYELLVVADRAYRLNRTTGEVDLLEMTGWRRVVERPEAIGGASDQAPEAAE
jgi:hypothetical protein